MLTVKLTYKDEYVLAHMADTLYFHGMGKLVFFHEPIAYDVTSNWDHFSYYGTLNKSLGEEFHKIPYASWNVALEQRLLREMANIGVIKGIASLFPVSEVNN